MERPELVIVVEGGVVITVATAKSPINYRIIDLDEYQVNDYTSSSGIDVEKFTKTLMEED